MKTTWARIDVADALPRRAVRQTMTSLVRQTHGSPWVLSGRRAALRDADRLFWRAWGSWWTAAAQFWAARGQSATDYAGRSRWYKSPPGDRGAAGREDLRREAGFVRAAAELPRLRRLLYAGRWSRSGLTWSGLTPGQLRAICPSPHRWERWLARVRARAAVILRPWDCGPSGRDLVELIGRLGCRRGLPPVGKTAVALSGMTLVRRFGLQGHSSDWAQPHLRGVGYGDSFTEWWRVVAAYRIYRQGGDPNRSVPPSRENVRRRLEALGDQSPDDRVSIWNPVIVAEAENGVLIRQDVVLGRRTTVQVVVRNPADGRRCHLTVPPQFGLPLWEGESAAARVHAAVAWTFGLSPADYRPAVES